MANFFLHVCVSVDGGKTSQRAENISSTTVQINNVQPTTNTSSATKPVNNENNTGPIIFVPVVNEVIFDPEDIYAVLPPPYPIAINSHQEDLQFVSVLDQLQEPSLPIDDYVHYFPPQTIPQLEHFFVPHYSIPEQNILKPVTKKVTESLDLPKPTPVVNNEEQKDKGPRNENEVLQRIMNIVKEFVIVNKMNNSDFRIITQPEDNHFTIKQMNEPINVEPDTTTSSEDNAEHSSLYTTQTDDSSRTGILMKLNETDKETTGTEGSQTLPTNYFTDSVH